MFALMSDTQLCLKSPDLARGRSVLVRVG